MTIEQMTIKLNALKDARYAGVRSVSYEGRSVTYGSDNELKMAISDLESEIAKALHPRSRMSRTYAVKGL
jgi:hypothetical protein